MDLELLRVIILSIGWPLLIIGSMYSMYNAVHFYKALKHSEFGKLLITMLIGWQITMFSLGVMATFYMFTSVKIGVIVVIPIFFVWFLSMLVIIKNAKKFRQGVLKSNEVYESLEETLVELNIRTQELSKEKINAEHITENMELGVVSFDDKGTIIFVNRKAKNILGIKEKGINSDTVKDLFLKKFAELSFQEELTKCKGLNYSNTQEISTHGRIYSISFQCANQIHPKKHFHGFIWIKDVTEERLIEKSKSNLINIASHQLRTPLTITRGNIEMLLEESFGSINEKQKELLDDVQGTTIRLINMVSIMLDMAKLEKNKYDVCEEIIDIQSIIDDVISDLMQEAQKRNISIQYQKFKEKLFTRAGSMEVRQIIQNILDNAIRYSKPGGRVTIHSVEKDDVIELSITDTGIGVPESEQEHIFSSFYRATNAEEYESVGSGLGLNIARSLAEKFGGKVKIKSREGKGTMVSVLFPKA